MRYYWKGSLFPKLFCGGGGRGVFSQDKPVCRCSRLVYPPQLRERCGIGSKLHRGINQSLMKDGSDWIDDESNEGEITVKVILTGTPEGMKD
ncbi:hypothetical protein CDAR_493291 [Caerostris darwini]|uniref:Uncharacterized protein n=1 Tax=Caerostris darwini TaxID=1538125 RepID=A0AAV4RWH6_9ARAC|nr:hypothetical protein CDAR_493291 [Caerostris darwini]